MKKSELWILNQLAKQSNEAMAKLNKQGYCNHKWGEDGGSYKCKKCGYHVDRQYNLKNVIKEELKKK